MMRYVCMLCLLCVLCGGCGDTSVNSESSAVANPDIVSGSEASIPPVDCEGCDGDAEALADYMWRVVNLVMDGEYESYGQAQQYIPNIEMVTEVYVEGVASLEEGEEPVSVEATFDDAIDDLLDNDEVNDNSEPQNEV